MVMVGYRKNASHRPPPLPRPIFNSSIAPQPSGGCEYRVPTEPSTESSPRDLSRVTLFDFRLSKIGLVGRDVTRILTPVPNKMVSQKRNKKMKHFQQHCYGIPSLLLRRYAL